MTGVRATKATRRTLPDVGRFEALAYLYRPVDPRTRHSTIEATEGWTGPAPDAIEPGVDMIIWGRLPRGGGGSLRHLPAAVRREWGLLSVRSRPPGDLRIAAIHRLPPPVWRPSRLRRAIRRALLSGVLVEFVRHGRPRRVIDEVVRAAGALPGDPRVRPSGDGSALARLPLPDGTSVELRVAPAGHLKDPMRGRAALLALEDAGVEFVPRAVAAGETAGTVWSTESVIPGRHATDVTQALLREITDVTAQLPEASARPYAVREQLQEVARVFPALRERLLEVAAMAESWSDDMPGVMLHGDLWMNNVLVDGGRLSGIVDWDTWHPAGMPGTDLLTLLASVERSRTGRAFGQLLMASHWRDPAVVDVLRDYFRARGDRLPDARGLAAIAVGWWASRVSGSLYRSSRPTEDPAWVRTNVERPLAWLHRLDRSVR